MIDDYIDENNNEDEKGEFHLWTSRLKLSRREKRDEKKRIGKNSINRKEIDS